ncbi:MAG TPA: hypothetical protein VIF15_05440 [Polyangiaceae bacterium]|jgi:hypothetical protein
MDQHTKRLAAAAYDRGLEAHRWAEDRALFVGVELETGAQRTLLCDLMLAGEPPEALRTAVADTLSVLRVAWIALLQAGDGARRRLDAVHAAVQCELVATEWTWSTRGTDGHALARALVHRRERHRQALTRPAPAGLGLLLPRQSRATEPLPESLLEARRTLALEAARAGRPQALHLASVAYGAIGGWRLGELEAASAAATIDEALGRRAAPVSSDYPAPLRAAS